MGNRFEDWLKRNEPAGQARARRLLAAAAAGTATAAVGLSVVLMAGMGLPPGELQAGGQTAAPAGRTVRYATALPTVTVVGRRGLADLAAPAGGQTAALPARTASVNATVGMAGTGDNLRQ